MIAFSPFFLDPRLRRRQHKKKKQDVTSCYGDAG